MSKLLIFWIILMNPFSTMADGKGGATDDHNLVIRRTTESSEKVTECSKKVHDPSSSSILFEQFAEFSEFMIHTTNYTLVTKPSLSWSDAVSACAANCQVLTSIQSLVEYDAIIKILKAPMDTWLGGTDQENGVYQWIEEPSRILSSAWSQGEPTNSWGSEHCTIISTRFRGLNDVPCSGLFPFICKTAVSSRRRSRINPEKNGPNNKHDKGCQGGQGQNQNFLINSVTAYYKQRRLHDHIYRLVRKPSLTWDEAAHACAENCGVLSSIRTPSELNFVNTLIKGTESAWLGGTDRIKREWRWIENGESIPEFFWSSSIQPDNHENDERHCTELREREGPGHDNKCTVKKSFVCKFHAKILEQNWLNMVPKIGIKVLKMVGSSKENVSMVPQTTASVSSGEKSFVAVYQLNEDSTKVSLSCQVFGAKRTDNVRWTKNGEAHPSHTQVVNKTYSWSQIDFGHVYRSTAGVYTCHAENDDGENFGTIRIRVDNPSREPDTIMEEESSHKSQNGKGDDDDQAKIIIVVSVSISLVVILPLVCISLVIIWRQVGRLRAAELNRNLGPDEILGFFNGQPVPQHGGGDGQIFPNGAINSLPYDRKFDVPRHCLELYENEVLGSGQFGIVVKGFVVKVTGERQIVAIKCAKKSVIDVSNFLALLAEIKIMAFLNGHENVASLIAACTDNIANHEAFAAIEFCENGNLAHFLKRKRHLFRNLFTRDDENEDDDDSKIDEIEMNNFDADQYDGALSTMTLLIFSCHVAKGMMYLTEKNVIHGDVAARNILLTGNLVPKISDFGLSRVLLNYTNYMKKSQTPIPWKWISIEALTRKEFSIKSDVWSFGILLWEIFSLANSPYPQYQLNEQFIKAITSGYRMKAPGFSNSVTYNIMLDCWNKEPKRRPEFSTIHQRLSQVLASISGDLEDS